MISQSFVPVRSPLASRKPKARRAPAFIARAARSVIETLEHRTLLSTTLTPVADTFVRDHNYVLTNYGAAPILVSKNASSGDDRRSFLKFDLTGITSIPSAILEVSGSLQNAQSTPAITGVYGVSDSSWIEGSGSLAGDTSNTPPGEMTWNNQPAVDSTSIATALITTDTYQTYMFDVTSYLQGQLAAGNTLVTLALQNVQETSLETDFLSRESTSNAGLPPELVIADANPAPPTAIISAPNVTDSTDPSTEVVNIHYSGSDVIDPTTIDASNIKVVPYGGGKALHVESFVNTTLNGDGSIDAAYTVDSPGNTWVAADNGPYAVSVKSGSVMDINGLGVSAAVGSFAVAVGDSIAPTSTLSAADVTSAGAATYSFTVTYDDNVAVDASGINIQNVAINGPVGPLNITGLSAAPNSNAPEIVVTYTATAPDGGWAASDNGQYVVTLHGNQIFDTAGNVASGNSTTFNVAIPIPDTTAPTATITAPNIKNPGPTPETVTVVYNDDVAIKASTINAGNLVVTGPGGGLLGVTLGTVTGNGATITATYNVAPPNGAWDSTDNGSYTATVLGGQVTDTSGNPLAAVSTTFSVSAAVSDTQPPSAGISAPAVVAAGGASEKITITYTDNVGIQLSSLGTGNISVSGPGGPLTVSNFSSTGSGKLVTATYTVAAPSGSWNAGDNGTYNIALNANEVRDTSLNAAPVIFGSFAVNIPLPNPTDNSFNGGSVVTYPFVAEASATEPNGKILLIGHQLSAGGKNQGVVRALNADGTPDTTFGNQGQVVTPAGDAQWFAVVMQGANHFVVAGTDNGDFALARYDFAGNLDPTFSGQGVALTDFGSPTDMAYAVAVSPTGQIVAAGMSNNRFAFARYDANGNIDSSFGEGGRQLFDTGAATQVLGAVAVQNDGRIVAAGSSGANIDVVRLTASGDADTTFNGDGVLAVSGLAADTSSTTPDYTVGLALQSDGKIVVANRTTSGHFGVLRLNADGTVDSSFGSAGIATANFGGADEADSVVIQGSGEIIAVGTSLEQGEPFEGVAAFDTTGKLITNFGENGMATFSTGTSSTTRELHIGDLFLRAFGSATSGGKILVGASSSAGTETVTSSLRRIRAPGTSESPNIEESLLGVFGLPNGKRTRLVVPLGSGRSAIFTLSRGTATALQAGNDIHLEVTGASAGALNVVVKGGGTITFTNIDITGGIASLRAPAASLSGTLTSATLGSVVLGALDGNVIVNGGVISFTAPSLSGTFKTGGNVGRLKFGTISGNVNVTGNITSITAGALSGSVYSSGTIRQAKITAVDGLIAAASQLVNLTAGSVANATVLAGANLGSDGLLGGSNTATDSFGAGTIGMFHVSGAITGSFVGAGVNPTDGTFGNGDDTAAGPGLIHTIIAKSADTTTRFESSAFGIARLPKKVDPTIDSRFIVL